MDMKEVSRRGGLSTLHRYGTNHYRKMGLMKKGKKSEGSGRKKKILLTDDKTSGSI